MSLWARAIVCATPIVWGEVVIYFETGGIGLVISRSKHAVVRSQSSPKLAA